VQLGKTCRGIGHLHRFAQLAFVRSEHTKTAALAANIDADNEAIRGGIQR
jgi:hypothetical protein